FPTIEVSTISVIILYRSFIGIQNRIDRLREAKGNKVTSTTPNDMGIAPPTMPNVGLEATKKRTPYLHTLPIKLFHIAGLAKSSACKAACKGACIYKTRKKGAIITKNLLAFAVQFIYVKMETENKDKTMVAIAPDANEMRID